MEVTRIHIEGIVKGLGVNGVRETFIDTTDPIDLTKPFFAVGAGDGRRVDRQRQLSVGCGHVPKQ